MLQTQLSIHRLEPTVFFFQFWQAAHQIENFYAYWERHEGDEGGRHELVKLIDDRVHSQGKRVVAMTLDSNYHLVLNHKTNGPTESSVDPRLSTYGSDRDRALSRNMQLASLLAEPKPPQTLASL